MKQPITLLLLCVLPFLSPAQVLWKITGDKLQEPSYLFGTIHMFVGIEDFSPELLNTLQSCEVVATEINTDSVNIMDFLPYMTMPDSVQYADFYSPSEYQLVDSVLKENLGYGLTMGQKFKPIMNTIMLGVGLKVPKTEEGLDAQRSIKPLDISIRDTANAYQKKTKALETATFQMEVLTDLAWETQFDMLLDIASNNDQSGEGQQLAGLLTAYCEQDLKALNAITQEDNIDPTWSRAVIEERNYAMADSIEVYCAETSVFVAIGAAHLAGSEGLVALLKQRGYVLQPVALQLSCPKREDD